jgi:hypothetical protein
VGNPLLCVPPVKYIRSSITNHLPRVLSVAKNEASIPVTLKSLGGIMLNQIIRSICVLGVLLVALVGFLVMGPLSSWAVDKGVSWIANTESDMAKYRLWICKTTGCDVQRTGNIPLAEIPHVVGQSSYVYTLPLNMVGQIAVDAVDTSGNASPLSNKLPFNTTVDLTPPKPVILQLN